MNRMTRWPTLVVAAVLMAGLSNGTAARAATVPSWSYTWSRSPVFLADQRGTGGIAFTSQPWVHTRGPGLITATSLVAFSSAYHDRPDHIVKQAYRLTLTLRDDTSKKVGTLNFKGVFNGTLAYDDVHITNTFTGLPRQAIHLGTWWYTVTIGPFTSPVPTGPAHISLGRIQAQVSIRHNPEPSGLVLAGLGSGVFSLFIWRRRIKKQTGHG
jgi:hypothetical protein